MNFLNGLTLFFYTIVFLLIGGCLIAVSLGLVSQETVLDTISMAYADHDIRLVAGVVGGLFIIITIMVLQLTIGRIKRERTIAFENPDGQVTIALTAIEDFIKRALRQLPEVKDLKPSVKAGKKGITIIAKVTLFSDAHIPETTEKIQSITKSRVQDMLGVDETIHIKVHVVKIAHKEEMQKEAKKDEKPNQFKGTIEYGNF